MQEILMTNAADEFGRLGSAEKIGPYAGMLSAQQKQIMLGLPDLINNELKNETFERVDLTGFDIREGKSISSTTGSVSSAAKYTSIVTFVPVVAGTVIKKGDLIAYVVFFSSAYKESIVSYDGSSTDDYVAPANGYVRITAKKKSGSEAPTVEEILANIKIIYPNTVKNAVAKLQDVISKDAIFENKYIFYSSGLVDSARFYNLTQLIDVDSNRDYYFSLTHDGSSAEYCALFAYDSGGNYVRTGYNNGNPPDTTNYASYFETALEASDNPVVVTKVFRFAPEVKKIAILYHKYKTTDLSLKTFFEADFLARQDILKLQADLQSLAKTCYVAEQSNPIYVKQILAVAESYRNRKDGNNNYLLQYGYNTVLSNSYNGNGGIDCSSYIGLVLRGIPFEDTEYNANASNLGTEDNDDNDGTDVEDLDDRTYSYDANPEYDWAINPYDYKLPTVKYGKEDAPKRVRTAAQLGQMLQMMGRSVWIDRHLANILPGDLVFFAKKKSDGTWIQEPRHMHISHVAIVKSKEAAPQNDPTWDAALYPYKHKLLEVRGTPGACTESVLESPGNYGPTRNGVHTLVLVCRPDLGQITADQPVEVELTGSTQTIVPKRNRVYKCGELTSLTITDPPANGAYSIVFTSGATATATTIPATIQGLESFTAEANTLYEINVLDNRALVGSWAVSASE